MTTDTTAPPTTAPAIEDQGATATDRIVSVRPVVLPAPGRGDDLALRITAPASGRDLPVVLFSHGFGMSMDAYGPLVDTWAAHGMVVVQPTHLDSLSLGLAPTDPRGPWIWRHRINDLVRILDEFATVTAAVPGLAERVDTTRIAVAGHSYGATTASALVGARVLAPAGSPDEDFTDHRVLAAVLLCLAGLAGDDLSDLSPLAAQAFAFMNPSFDHLDVPALIVAGDADQSVLTSRGPDWWTDAFRLSPGGKSLLTVHGAQHGLGGIDAYGGLPQTPAENPATVALIQRTTTAYLRTALGVDATSWPAAQDALARATQADQAAALLESS